MYFINLFSILLCWLEFIACYLFINSILNFIISNYSILVIMMEFMITLHTLVQFYHYCIFYHCLFIILVSKSIKVCIPLIIFVMMIELMITL